VAGPNWAGPNWADDDPAEAPLIAGNCADLLRDLAVTAAQRPPPTLFDVRQWHRRIYAGCVPPLACYVGNFRGDARYAELVDFEVGIGTPMPDGLPEKVGVWARDLQPLLDAFEQGLQRAVAVLDTALPVGQPPATVDELDSVVRLAAEVHGEWLRLHPFANGNGPTARVWAASLALRYALPVFVQLKPRPDDVAYVRAAKRSMGRPPDFRGHHQEAFAVFAHMLTLSLLP
jgi:fido (protein-threonine AMPylation protein)